MNVVNNTSVICNDKTTTENDLSASLPQSSSTSEEPAVSYCEKDKIVVNALTTMVKIANDTIELVYPSRLSKEMKSLPRISNIRKSEGPFVNLIDLNTPPMQGKLQNKYTAPIEISKAPLTSEAVTYCEKDKIVVNALTTIVKIANDTIELVYPSRPSKEMKSLSRISNIRKSEGPFVNLIDLNTPPMQGKLQNKYTAPIEISKAPLTSEAVTYCEKDKIVVNALTTMVKIANDTIELVYLSRSSKEMKSLPRISYIRKSEGPFVNLIDLNTPPMQGKLQKLTVTYFEKDQIIFNNLTTMIKIANDFIELLSSSTEITETKNWIDITTPVQNKLQRKYMRPRKILKEPQTLSNSNIPQAKRIGTLKHMERCTRSTENLTPPQYTSSPKRKINPSATQNGVSHKKKLLRSSTYTILPTEVKTVNLSNGRKKSASEDNLTITLDK